MPNGIRTKIPLIYFRHLKVSWVKTYQMSCLLIFTSIYPLTKLIGLAVEMYRMKTLLDFLETRTLLIQQKMTDKVGLQTNNTQKVTVSKSWTMITVEKEMKKPFIITQK